MDPHKKEEHERRKEKAVKYKFYFSFLIGLLKMIATH